MKHYSAYELCWVIKFAEISSWASIWKNSHCFLAPRTQRWTTHHHDFTTDVFSKCSKQLGNIHAPLNITEQSALLMRPRRPSLSFLTLWCQSGIKMASSLVLGTTKIPIGGCEEVEGLRLCCNNHKSTIIAKEKPITNFAKIMIFLTLNVFWWWF